MPIEVDCRYVVSCRRTEAFCGIPFFISKDFPMELKTFALRWLRDKVLRTASLLATRSGVTRQWRTTCSIQHQRDRGREEAENYNKTVALYISICHKSSIRLLYWMEQIHFSYVKAVVQKATALKKIGIFSKNGQMDVNVNGYSLLTHTYPDYL